jgi:hypothetical protein
MTGFEHHDSAGDCGVEPLAEIEAYVIAFETYILLPMSGLPLICSMPHGERQSKRGAASDAWTSRAYPRPFPHKNKTLM